jgi:hypothetical protein
VNQSGNSDPERLGSYRGLCARGSERHEQETDDQRCEELCHL